MATYMRQIKNSPKTGTVTLKQARSAAKAAKVIADSKAHSNTGDARTVVGRLAESKPGRSATKAPKK